MKLARAFCVLLTSASIFSALSALPASAAKPAHNAAERRIPNKTVEKALRDYFGRVVLPEIIVEDPEQKLVGLFPGWLGEAANPGYFKAKPLPNGHYLIAKCMTDFCSDNGAIVIDKHNKILVAASTNEAVSSWSDPDSEDVTVDAVDTGDQGFIYLRTSNEDNPDVGAINQWMSEVLPDSDIEHPVVNDVHIKP